MPVRFESRYDRDYTWNGRGDITPLTAGLASRSLGNTTEPPIQHKKVSSSPDNTMTLLQTSDDYQAMEPPLQRKKRPIIPKGTQKAPTDGSGDYMLLGKQSKFASNVKYGTKGKVDHRTHGVAEERAPSPPPAPRRPPTPPRVEVDTGAPKIYVPPNPKTTFKSKSTFTAGQAEKKGRPSQNGQSVQPIQSRQHGQHDHTEQPPQRYHNDPARQQNAQTTQPNQSRQPPQRYHNDPAPQFSQAAPQVAKRTAEKRKASKPVSPTQIAPTKEVKVKDARQKRKGRMDEDVQTNLDQGVSSSLPHAPSDYAMKYKAGIAPPRSQGPKRVSEYQLQFQWKDPVNNSPLLSAEQMVYHSTSNVGPYKEAIPKKSEYAMQFQGSHVGQPDPEIKPQKKSKLKRSRSLEDVVQRPPAGKARVTSDADKRLVEGSMNPLRTFFPTGKTTEKSSEYLANFAPPNKFQYKGGAWKGAMPPHISRAAQAVENVAESSPTWYNEVLELRQKADEYRKRAQGTHFSREHLAQLYAQQAELWDTVSNSGSLSALSLERSDSVADFEITPKVSPKASKVKLSKKKKRSYAVQTTPREAWGDDGIDGVSAAMATAGSEELGYYDDDDASTLVGDENYPPAPTPPPSQASSSVGRVPTPKLATASSSKTSSYRHHLDRTTPIHGALLASPPRQSVSNPVVRKSGKSSSRGSVASSESSAVMEPPRKATSAPVIAGQLPRHATPTFGMPTRDSHLLLDDEASVDRPMDTHFVHSPEKSKLSVIDENMGGTYDQRNTKGKSRPMINGQGQAWEVKLDDIPHRDQDDDVLSMSVRSVASSCSLASEVLERAKNRRDEFWGSKKAASRS